MSETMSLFTLHNISLQTAKPSGPGLRLAEIENIGIQETLDIHICVITLDNLRLKLNLTDNPLHLLQRLRLHIRHLVKQNHIAELNLLNDKVFDIFFLKILPLEILSAAELVHHSESIHDSDDAVKSRRSELRINPADSLHRRDCLGDRLRLTDTAGLDDDVVELVHLHNLDYLLHEVGLQSTADAPVLESDQTVVLLAHHSALLNKGCVNVYFTYIVHDDCEPYPFLILENTVHKSCLSTSEISC